MSELSAENAVNSEDSIENIENTIMNKLKNFFGLYGKLKYEQLNLFLDSLDLSHVFGTDEEKEFIWSIFNKISNGEKEIDYEVCSKGMMELFNENCDKNDTNCNNLRSSLQSKEKKLIIDVNSGSDLNLKKNNESNLGKIAQTIAEIDFEKLQQLRKAFSLLDLRNKGFVYISELQEVIRKYKFIKLTQEELIKFLSLISDDLSQAKGEFCLYKLSINFELYSKAMSVIEQQLLRNHSDTFEHNDSFEVHDSYGELIDELYNAESENVDYIMVLADVVKSLEFRIYDSIVGNYEKIITKTYIGNETEEQLYQLIHEGKLYFKSKLRDMEIFLKELSHSSKKKQNKLNYLKIIVNKLETDLKNSEADFRDLFQKMNENKPYEVNDELEKLIEENAFLSEQKDQKKIKIEELEKKIDEKDELIFNLQSKVDKLVVTEREFLQNYNELKKEYDGVKLNHDTLMNDLYEKIKFEENNSTSNGNRSSPSKKGKSEVNSFQFSNITNISQEEKDIIIKLREKLIINEENKKLFEMNYEQLILYTLKIESANKQLEDKIFIYEKRKRENETEIIEIKKINTENSKNIHLLRSENSRLQNKISELNKEIEINQVFRPSSILGNRMSKIDDRKSKISTGIIFTNPGTTNNRFQKMEKIFEQDKRPENNQDKTQIRISQMVENLENPNPNSSSIEGFSLTNTNAFFSQKDSFNYNDRFLFDEKNIMKTESSISLREYIEGENTNNFTCGENKNKTSQNGNLINIEVNPDDTITNMTNKNFSFKNKDTTNLDSIEENPFSFKEETAYALVEDDEDKDYMKNIENVETAETNVNKSVDLKSIARHSPFEIDINLNKREELKRRENSINGTAKKNSRVPSRVMEEIIEEDVNGEFSSSKSNRLSHNTMLRYSNLSREDSRLGPGHNRAGTIDDIGAVFNKDSQYMCYDFLTLRRTEAVIKMFEDNHEDVSSYEMFSDNVYIIDEFNKKSKKNLFITSNYVYMLRPEDLTVKTRINLKNLDKLTISNKNCNLIALHFKEGDDLLIEILRRMELLYFFRDLYGLKRYGKLKFKYSDNFKIKRNNAFSNIIVDQTNNFFIAPNFDSAQKLGYLSKLANSFFTKFKEKLVVLTNVGLLYFDDPNKPPKKLIPIIGSDILRVDEKRFKKKHCFEIKTLNGESYIFSTNSNEELESWLLEFKTFKKNYEKKIKNIDNKK